MSILRRRHKSDVVGFDDINDLLDTFETIDGSTPQKVVNAVLDGIGQEVADRASANAPVDTGELKNSYRVERTRNGVRVYSIAGHASFVEFGTWSHNVHRPRQGTYTIRPKNPDGVLRFTAKDGNVVFAKSVEHPGIKPQFPLTRAEDEVAELLNERIANAGVKMVVG